MQQPAYQECYHRPKDKASMWTTTSTGAYVTGEGGYLTDMPWKDRYTAEEVTRTETSKVKQPFCWDGKFACRANRTIAGEKAIKIKSMLKYRRKKCFFCKKCTKSLLILIQKSKKKISAMKMAFYAKRDQY